MQCSAEWEQQSMHVYVGAEEASHTSAEVTADRVVSRKQSKLRGAVPPEK